VLFCKEKQPDFTKKFWYH